MSLSLGAQAVVVGVAGLALGALIIKLTRVGLLSLRYGMGWLVVAGAIGGAAALLGAVAPIARRLEMTPTGFLSAAASGFLLLLALQLSISVSGLQDAVRDLSESNALLEERLRDVERPAE